MLGKWEEQRGEEVSVQEESGTIQFVTVMEAELMSPNTGIILAGDWKPVPHPMGGVSRSLEVRNS